MKHTLLLGSDTVKKDHFIAQCKTSLFQDDDKSRFDVETIHAHKIPADVFKQTLMALPAMAPQRLLVIRDLKKLTAQNQTILLAFLAQQRDHVIIIADGEGMDATTALSKKLKPYMNVQQYGQRKVQNIFDVTNALSAGRHTEAMKALDQLMSEGQHPLQLLGGVIWFWGKQKTRLSSQQYKKGLLEIQEADMRIKRSRLKAEYVIEILVTKMSLLMRS